MQMLIDWRGSRVSKARSGTRRLENRALRFAYNFTYGLPFYCVGVLTISPRLPLVKAAQEKTIGQEELFDHVLSFVLSLFRPFLTKVIGQISTIM